MRGDERTFLGMKLKIKDKKIQMDMREQLQEAIDAFGKELGDFNVVSPAGKGLMVINEDDIDLKAKRSEIFCS
eukprot:13820677-Ditylum_brightwellii.AAC.1